MSEKMDQIKAQKTIEMLSEFLNNLGGALTNLTEEEK